MTWTETYKTITKMKDKFDRCGYATKTFHREDYHDVLCVLSNEEFVGDRRVHVKVNIQDGILGVQFKEKKK